MSRWLKIFSRSDGNVAVEFAMILPALALLMLGGMDLAHGYYIEHIITNASREGARYAAKYTFPTNAPSSDQISTYVKTVLNYNSFNLDDLNVNGSYTGTSPTQVATVTVQAAKYWWILGSFLPNPRQLSAKTAMTVEGP